MRFRAILVVCLLIALASPVAAQTFYLDQPPQERSVVGIRALKPLFDNQIDDQFSTFTSSSDIYFSLYFNDQISLRLEIPYTHVGLAEGYSSSDSDDGIGNLYIGVQKWTNPKPNNRLVYSVGIRPPTASDENVGAASVGYITDLYHIGRALPNIWTIEGSSAYHRIPTAENDYLFSLEAGPTALFPTQNGDPELLVHYGGAFGSRINHLLLSAELSGLFLITQHVPDFGDRFDHQFAVGITMIGYPVKPQVFYQFPLDSGARDILDGLVGLRLEYAFSTPSRKSDWD
jgi:hypothetical protein